MKTDRRQELKQNQLADYLARWIEVVKPYTRLIVGVVISLVVIVVVMELFQYQSKQTIEEAWNDLHLKGLTYDRGRSEADFEVLAELASEKADQPVGQWALLSSADHRLARGVLLVLKFGGWDRGQKELQTAIQDYQVVLDKADPQGDDLPQQRALFGQARAYESRGELEEARKRYEQLIDPIEGWPEGPNARAAKERLVAIDTPAVKRFYIELKNTVESQANPLGVPIDNAKPDPLKEKSDPLKKKPDSLDPSDPLGGGDLRRLLGLPPLPSDPPAEKKPAGDDTAPDKTAPDDTTPTKPKDDDKPGSTDTVPESEPKQPK